MELGNGKFGILHQSPAGPAPEATSCGHCVHWELSGSGAATPQGRAERTLHLTNDTFHSIFISFLQTLICPTSGIYNKSLQRRKLFCLMWNASKKTQTISTFFFYFDASYNLHNSPMASCHVNQPL